MTWRNLVVAVTVFNAFPQAVISGVWEIGKVQRATEVGTVISQKNGIDVIVDDVTGADLSQSPSADGTKIQTLLYAKPEQIPTLETAAICAEYILIKNNSHYFNITDCALAKNQNTGQIEHVELSIQETEAL